MVGDWWVPSSVLHTANFLLCPQVAKSKEHLPSRGFYMDTDPILGISISMTNHLTKNVSDWDIYRIKDTKQPVLTKWTCSSNCLSSLIFFILLGTSLLMCLRGYGQNQMFFTFRSDTEVSQFWMVLPCLRSQIVLWRSLSPWYPSVAPERHFTSCSYSQYMHHCGLVSGNTLFFNSCSPLSLYPTLWEIFPEGEVNHRGWL